jgi:predicted Zn-dependent protease
VLIAADQIDSDAKRLGAQFGALLALTAFDSRYSRNQEDQADRVGLRYAYEGGFDVSEGPRLWERFRGKYGNGNKVTNFFFGGHSRPSDRIKTIRRELAINYPDAIKQAPL